MLDIILIAQLATHRPGLLIDSIEPVRVDFQQQGFGTQPESRAEYLKKQQETLNQTQKALAAERKQLRKRLPASTLECHPAYGGYSPQGLFSTCPHL